MIEKEQWLITSSPGLEISCLESDARSFLKTECEPKKTVAGLKVALEKICDNFREVQLTKLFLVLETV